MKPRERAIKCLTLRDAQDNMPSLVDCIERAITETVEAEREECAKVAGGKMPRRAYADPEAMQDCIVEKIRAQT